ncbi:hypothetical protein SLEP1_g54069 [Rubroshorea leprosula]|uniref:Uncharacterized protein n=1 Tax=Rubroshorea leprosula TaxID=152421 RepID=A0AAV5MBP4_9ROSI|nr:hypothetical protein SLEP1_g54069 [Rubroshorea leprosula]
MSGQKTRELASGLANFGECSYCSRRGTVHGYCSRVLFIYYCSRPEGQQLTGI